MLEDEPLAHVWIGVSMLNMSRRAVLTGGALIGTVAIALPTLAAGSGTPANKATAAGASTVPVTTDGAVDLLTAKLKTSKPTDLLLSVSLECAIFTRLVTNNAKPSSLASASVRAWLEVKDEAGNTRVVPIESKSQPPQEGSDPNTGDAIKDGVTFCQREVSRTVTDGEMDALGRIDTQDDYMRTKSAHSFNWVLLNAGSGLRTITLKAIVESSDDTGTSESSAMVGNRTLVIEPTKMANDAVIAPSGSS